MSNLKYALEIIARTEELFNVSELKTMAYLLHLFLTLDKEDLMAVF